VRFLGCSRGDLPRPGPPVAAAAQEAVDQHPIRSVLQSPNHRLSIRYPCCTRAPVMFCQQEYCSQLCMRRDRAAVTLHCRCCCSVLGSEERTEVAGVLAVCVAHCSAGGYTHGRTVVNLLRRLERLPDAPLEGDGRCTALLSAGEPPPEEG